MLLRSSAQRHASASCSKMQRDLLTRNSRAAASRRHAGTTCTRVVQLQRTALLCNASASSNGSSSSSSTSGKKKQSAATRAAKSGGGSSTSTVAAAAVVTATPAANVSAQQAPTTGSKVSSSISSGDGSTIIIANPPLGFSNNIVPAAPRGATVNAPRSRSPDEYESDESMDDEIGSAAGSNDASGASGRSTSRSAAYRCLVLDSRYLPVNVISWFRAVVMDGSGKVDVLEYHPGGYAYSAYKAHALPAVLRVRTFVDVHEFAGRLSLTRKNIMLRDHNRCQYCGCQRDLTLDHVVPVSQGGVNSWSNLVTACMPCNQRKGNKSLAQLGWSLPCVPREPTPQEVGVIAGISKSDLSDPPVPWAPYLTSFKAMLDKAQRRAAAATAAGAAASRPSWPDSSSSSSSSRSGGFEPVDLVSVTMHPAGAGSKAAKAAAAAAAAAAGGGVAGKAAAGSKVVVSKANKSGRVR